MRNWKDREGMVAKRPQTSHQLKSLLKEQKTWSKAVSMYVKLHSPSSNSKPVLRQATQLSISTRHSVLVLILTLSRLFLRWQMLRQENRLSRVTYLSTKLSAPTIKWEETSLSVMATSMGPSLSYLSICQRMMSLLSRGKSRFVSVNFKTKSTLKDKCNTTFSNFRTPSVSWANL